DYLIKVEPGLAEAILFQEERLDNFDMVIATGSDNTARYFNYYFKDKPRIIRRNRVSAAILNGSESQKMLLALGDDIFRYFGLGCRSVSKLYVPEDYNFDQLFKALYPFNEIIALSKYANNYDYNKAVYLMSEYSILDNGFLLLKEDENFGSPIATLFYEKYRSFAALKEKLDLEKDALQCIVADGLFPDEVPFGQTQFPGLEDYADGIDTVEFLLKTSHN
ncbi:MAG: acyl-CoA reductase, partial [Eudoraea sp.]|nr:acyl-CoA reductase [Eudoraea sp.]